MKKTPIPKILEIVGDSGVGKSELSKGILAHLNHKNVSIISSDDYHTYDRKQRKSLSITPLNPSANNINLLEQHLEKLSQGIPVYKPCYNHSNGSFDLSQYVKPSSFIITEGLFFAMRKEENRKVTLRVYLDSSEYLKKKWKINRDVIHRGYSEQEVITELKLRKLDFEQYIDPQKHDTDIIISFFLKEKYNKNVNLRFGIYNQSHDTRLHNFFSKLDIKYVRFLKNYINGQIVNYLEIDGDTSTEAINYINNFLLKLLWEDKSHNLNIKSTIEKINLSNLQKTAQLLLVYYWFISQ